MSCPKEGIRILNILIGLHTNVVLPHFVIMYLLFCSSDISRITIWMDGISASCITPKTDLFTLPYSFYSTFNPPEDSIDETVVSATHRHNRNPNSAHLSISVEIPSLPKLAFGNLAVKSLIHSLDVGPLLVLNQVSKFTLLYFTLYLYSPDYCIYSRFPWRTWRLFFTPLGQVTVVGIGPHTSVLEPYYLCAICSFQLLSYFVQLSPYSHNILIIILFSSPWNKLRYRVI